MNNKIAVFLSEGTCITPYGKNLAIAISKIEEEKSAIQKIKHNTANSIYGAKIDLHIIVQAFSDLPYKGTFTKLEKMMLIAAHELVEKYQKYFNHKCGLIISSTKGNIEALQNGENEQDYYLSHLAKKIALTIGIKMQPIVLSNACVSGIMALSIAKRLIQTEKYDHFLVIGADLFSKFVVDGFQSFNAVSASPCKPYDKERDGISLGEAAAAVFVTKEQSILEDDIIFELLGDSNINDANHISGPSRTGEGLFQSTENALKEAKLSAKDIDCVSSHGTATLYNDEMEGQAFNRSNLTKTPVFSLKGYIGHTLGAAGLIETIITLAFAKKNQIPRSLGYKTHGITVPLNITQKRENKNIDFVLKTASGFGGSNSAVIFKKIASNES